MLYPSLAPNERDCGSLGNSRCKCLVDGLWWCDIHNLPKREAGVACSLIWGILLWIHRGLFAGNDGARHQQESSSAATANTDKRKHMVYEDRKTVRNVEAQIYTVHTMIADMPEAAEVGGNVRMML